MEFINLKRVLVVVDMQVDFVTGSLGSDEAKAIVPKAVEKVKEAIEDPDTYVIFTKDTHDEHYLDSFEGKNLPVEHCIKDTEGWEIIPELKELIKEDDKNVEILEKESFGSPFIAKDIITAIRTHMPEDKTPKTKEDAITFFNERTNIEIEFIGLCTDICVISNVLIVKPCFANNTISVDAACCAGVTPELHKAALDVMKSCQVTIKNND